MDKKGISRENYQRHKNRDIKKERVISVINVEFLNNITLKTYSRMD